MGGYISLLPLSTAIARWGQAFWSSGEGVATMSLLSVVKANPAKALLPLAIVVFLSLPVSITFQSQVKAIGPTVAWAGSPDETLNPPPSPTKRCAKLKSTSEGTSATRIPMSSRYLFGVLWRVYWATVRF